MSDLFHDQVPTTYIQDVFEVMKATPRHTYQLLTKRSKRLARLSEELSWPENVWMGVSIESHKYLFRKNDLLKSGAKTKFLSLEPLLGPLEELTCQESNGYLLGVNPDWAQGPPNPIGYASSRLLRSGCTLLFQAMGRSDAKGGWPCSRWANLRCVSERAGKRALR